MIKLQFSAKGYAYFAVGFIAIWLLFGIKITESAANTALAFSDWAILTAFAASSLALLAVNGSEKQKRLAQIGYEGLTYLISRTQAASLILFWVVCYLHEYLHGLGPVYWLLWSFMAFHLIANTIAAIGCVMIMRGSLKSHEVVCKFVSDNRDELNRLRAKLKKVSK